MNDSTQLILGIDPGFTGGLAWYDIGAKRLLAVMPMPLKTNELVMSGETRREIDVLALSKAIERHGESIAHIIVEQVNSSPQMGVVGAFRFGEGLGLIRGVLAAQGYLPKMVYPNVWKSAMNLSSDKKKSIELACELFPEWGSTLRGGKKSADLAEAALLAYYGLRFIKDTD